MSEPMDVTFLTDTMPVNALPRSKSIVSTSSKDEGVVSTGELDEEDISEYVVNLEGQKKRVLDGLTNPFAGDRLEEDEGRGSMYEGMTNELRDEDILISAVQEMPSVIAPDTEEAMHEDGHSENKLFSESDNRLLKENLLVKTHHTSPASNVNMPDQNQIGIQSNEVQENKKRKWRKNGNYLSFNSRVRKSRLRSKLNAQKVDTDAKSNRVVQISNNPQNILNAKSQNGALQHKKQQVLIKAIPTVDAERSNSKPDDEMAQTSSLVDTRDRPVAPPRFRHSEETSQPVIGSRKESRAEIYIPHEDKFYVYTYSSQPKLLQKKRYIRKLNEPNLTNRNSRGIRTTNFSKDNIPKWNPYFAYARSLSRSNLKMYETEEVKARRSEFRRKMEERAKLRRENLGISSLYPSRGGAVIIKGSTLQPKLKGEEAIVFALATNIIREAALEIAMEAETDRAKMAQLAGTMEVYENSKEEPEDDEQRAEPEGEEAKPEDEVGNNDELSTERDNDLTVEEPTMKIEVKDGHSTAGMEEEPQNENMAAETKEESQGENITAETEEEETGGIYPPVSDIEYSEDEDQENVSEEDTGHKSEEDRSVGGEEMIRR